LPRERACRTIDGSRRGAKICEKEARPGERSPFEPEKERFMISKVIARLEKEKQKAVDELVDLLKIPSVSADPSRKADIRRAADWLARRMTAAGLRTEVKETAGNPIVYAERSGPAGAPTILIYGHYDVQPPDPLDEWKSPPFEPVIRDGKVLARGSSDDKGQLLTHVHAIGAWIAETGSLPIHVKVILEGEEEISSLNLPTFLREHRDMLKCDVVVVSDTSQFAHGVPAITYGLKGLAYVEVRMQGPAADLHSGSFGGSIRNPANALAELIADLHDEKGRVAIPGFYDDVKPLEEWERKEYARLPFSEAEYLKITGSPALWGEDGYTTTERRWARPTLDVNGIWGGYQGEGAKTIIPARAGAKISMRLVPNQDPEKISKLFADHVRKIVPPSVRVEVIPMHGGKPFLIDPKSPMFEKASLAIEKGFGRKPVFIREGGSIPITQTFKEVLGADTLLLGWGQNDDGAHSPNERFDLEDYHKGTLSSAYLIGLLGA
jgi:acetylornithine deacetylase/succinyl-diaminopimelate desuccinylase-like protein